MISDVVIAIIGGLAGTSLMTGMMVWGKQIGLPAIDVHGTLGYIRHADRRTALGYSMHWLLGVVFALPYVLIFRESSGSVFVRGAVFGVIHWLLVGWMFAFAPLMHAGMQAGTVKKSGAYMTESLGAIGFVGGMVGHIVFGLTVALIYTLLV